MERYVVAQPNGGYARHAYRFENHGLDAEAERKKFRAYMLRFGVSPESGGLYTSPALALRDSHMLSAPASKSEP
jgi:hypothetical protein